MRKLLLPVAAFFLLTSISSCAKCFVCKYKDKEEGTFTKTEHCDKDYSKGDINTAIRSYEASGATCHPSSRAL